MASWLKKYGVTVLRISLGIVFLWFGTLKILGISPVAELVAETYTFSNPVIFLQVLGVFEVIIGLGLIFKVALRFIIVIFWIQMAGTFFSALLTPSMFFTNGNIFELTMNGEFLLKNLVLVAASFIIYE
jgi:uncharacterized membrane protein YkgB